MTTTSYHIQTNLDIDKYDVFIVEWHDIDNIYGNSFATAEAAKERMQQPLELRHISVCNPWYHILKPENLRIVKRITQEEVI